MLTKVNRKNHDFQIVNFMVRSCHTADAAYALLCNERTDRQLAIATYHAESKRQEAKRLRANAKLKSEDRADQLEAEADLDEIEVFAALALANFKAAEAELQTIDKCIGLIQPLRKFAHLPDDQAHEAAQRDEWARELTWRGACAMITTGSIPTEQYKAMRLHPDYHSYIEPALADVEKTIRLSGAAAALPLLTKKEFLTQGV